MMKNAYTLEFLWWVQRIMFVKDVYQTMVNDIGLSEQIAFEITSCSAFKERNVVSLYELVHGGYDRTPNTEMIEAIDKWLQHYQNVYNEIMNRQRGA